MTQPKVSVIIPVYNTEKYLRECLNSVVNQTLTDIEIICVDDGSTDSSPEILAEYAGKDDRFTILSQKNLYAGVARNYGMSVAKGEYLCFLDSDDIFELEMLEKAYAKAIAADSDIVIWGGVHFDDATGKETDAPWLLAAAITAKCDNAFSRKEIPDRIFNITSPAVWNKLFKKDYISRMGIEFQPLHSTNDLFFTYCAIAAAERISVLPQILVHYRTGNSNSIQGTKAKDPTAILKALLALKKQLIEWEIFDELERSFVNMALNNIAYNLNSLPKGEPYNELCLGLDAYGFDELGIDKKGRGYFYYPKNYDIGFTAVKEKLLSFLSNECSECPQRKPDGVFEDDANAPEGFEKVVPVVFAANDNYLPYAAVAIESLFANSSPNNFYRVYILHTELSQNRISEIESMRYQNGAVRCVNIDALINSKQAVLYERWHFTKEMYYRFLIADLFDFFEYAIYLDCDVIITTDIATIIPKTTDNYLMAAVRNNMSAESGKRIERDFAVEYKNYINSGVLVINISQWQREDSVAKCFDMLKTTPAEKLVWCDQDILNVVCKDRIYFLDEKWNFYWHMIYGDKSYVDICKPVAEYIGDDFKILHFASDIKPWNRPELPHSKYFWQYARQTCFYEEILLRASKKNAAPAVAAAKAPVSSPTPAEKAVSPDEKRLKARIELLQLKLDRANQEIWNIHHSWTYRIGRFITWLPRKVRGFVRCYHEHGAYYTYERVLVHLHLKPDPYKAKPIKKPVKAEQKQTPAPIKRDYDYYSKLSPDKYKAELAEWFERTTGEKADFDSPKTFNQKIQWLKLYDSTPIKTRLADKYLVREWVKEKIGEQYLVPLLGVWDSFDEINFDELPEQFALKTNHGSGWNIIVDGKAKLDIEAAKKKFDLWMSRNYAFQGGLELHYMNIPRKIIAEEYIADTDGNIFDYRFLCFDGEPRFIWQDIGCGTSHHKRNIYDVDWNLQDFTATYPPIMPVPQKPDTLFEMLSCVKKMCAGFSFVRVDFCSVNEKIYFGEMTFTAHNGTVKWSPPEYNRIFGDLITLPEKSPYPERKN